MFPTALAMTFELGAYGFLTGFLSNLLPRKKAYAYVVLILSMIGGKVL